MTIAEKIARAKADYDEVYSSAYEKGKTEGGGSGGGVIELTRPPEIAETNCYFRSDTSPESYSTLEQLLIASGYDAVITYYVVDALPENPNITDMSTANPCHIYIHDDFGYMYGNLGSGNMWATVGAVLGAVSGGPVPDLGYTSDITAETSMGVYVTYGTVNNFEEGNIYRVVNTTTPIEGFIITMGTVFPLESLFQPNIYVVDTLPDTMTPTDIENMAPGMSATIYVLNDTGVGYISPDGSSSISLGTVTGKDQVKDPDKGWVDDIYSIDATAEENTGIYYTRPETTITYYIYSDGALRDYVDGESSRKLAVTVSELEPSANFTKYATLQAVSAGDLSLVDITDTTIISMAISDSVTMIGGYAFSGCSELTSVTIPDSVTIFGFSAFYRCSGLTSIHFNGTKAQWNAITKNSDWDSGTGDYTVYCTDGTIAKDGTET